MNMLQLIFELSELLPEGLRRIAESEPHRVRPGMLELVHHTSRMILHGLDVIQNAHNILQQPLDDTNDRYKDEFNRQNLAEDKPDQTDQTDPRPPGASSKPPGTPPPPVESKDTLKSLSQKSSSVEQKDQQDAHTSNSDSDWESDTDYTANEIKA
jgi:hypothetical protein